MTISEEIREAALYARDPWWYATDDAFRQVMVWRTCSLRTCSFDWASTEGRTFMLLVAEALE